MGSPAFEAYRLAAVGGDDVVLEGLHALKHALRFGAHVALAVSPDPDAAVALARELAPDLEATLAGLLQEVSPAEFDQLKPRSVRTLGSPVLAVARRPTVDAAGLLAPGVAPVVVLHEPRYAGNAGAVVRVAAAAGAGGVGVTGDLDPWGPAVLRAAAGLHWALPVARLAADELAASARPLVCFDPDGDLFPPAALPSDALLIFGGERRGVPPTVTAAARHVWRLPMTPGVSSLNLATSVSAVLYAWRLAR